MYMYVLGVYRGQERCVSVKQNIENAGGSGNKYKDSEELGRSKRQKETGACLPTALHCFYSTKQL